MNAEEELRDRLDDILVGHSHWILNRAQAIDHICAAFRAHAGRDQDSCEWWNDGEMWESSCGVAYMFNSDGPEDNGHRFCHKCGKRIQIAVDENKIITEGE